MAERAVRPSVFTIAVHQPFADALADGVLARFRDADLGLAKGLILLPNARAVEAVRDAFVRASGEALLLPRLLAIGDGDLDARAGATFDRLAIDAEESPLPLAVDPWRRRLVLMDLIAARRPHLGAADVLRLADAFARAIDACAVEEVDLRSLRELDIAERLSQHWEESLGAFLQLADAWHGWLAEAGLVDRAQRTNLALDRTAARWRSAGFDHDFVVAAGITTSAPAIARLQRVIAAHERGAVVLPHLDLALDDEDWAALGGDPQAIARAVAKGEDPGPRPRELHPQYHLKLLLHRLGVHRGEVRAWPGRASEPGPESRVTLVHHLLALPERTSQWATLPRRAIDPSGIVTVTADTAAEEAQTIAVLMREALETPGRTASLVTPDRGLAARVARHLARWGIVAEDSAGAALSALPAGELLLAIARAAASDFAPVELIALLTHPAVRRGEGRLRWLDLVRDLDLALRGPRAAQGLAALGDWIARTDERNVSKRLREAWPEMVAPLRALDAALAAQPRLSLADALEALRQALLDLSGDDVFAQADGRALGETLDALLGEAHAVTRPVEVSGLGDLLRVMLDAVSVRLPYGGHPRLAIRGLLEARLQRSDVTILGGLNEGQWPAAHQPDPWLAPLVRRTLGLPGTDRQAGLAAHDFASALGASEVIVTRARRDGTAPTVASRLLLRLEALVGDPDALAGEGRSWLGLARALDAQRHDRPIARPQFEPPPHRRPRRISVTQVEQLLADPFSFYARVGLDLPSLDRLDAPLGPPTKGNLLHAVLEAWVQGGADSLDGLMAIADAHLAAPGITDAVRALWGPRAKAALEWAGTTIIAAQREGRSPAVVERKGTLAIGDVTLSGKPDRIDSLPDGTLAVVDYKTGTSPKKVAVEAGFALQLGLLGAMVERGGFGDDSTAEVSGYEYWRLRRSDKGAFGYCEAPFSAKGSVQADNFADLALRKTEAAVRSYLIGDEPFVAKLHPEWAPYGDYDQLMRFEEWNGRDGEPVMPAHVEPPADAATGDAS